MRARGGVASTRKGTSRLASFSAVSEATTCRTWGPSASADSGARSPCAEDPCVARTSSTAPLPAGEADTVKSARLRSFTEPRTVACGETKASAAGREIAILGGVRSSSKRIVFSS